ncbi:MAG: hypothetical protein J6B98_06165 [Bacilli bacterium]|nr:hypothetical protein [Bacilli bacterium]
MNEKNTPKGNVEIEGVNVPDDNMIISLLKKYKDKLDPDTIDSFLYLLNKNIKEESRKENEDKSRRSIRK